jgi:hypothetical protein
MEFTTRRFQVSAPIRVDHVYRDTPDREWDQIESFMGLTPHSVRVALRAFLSPWQNNDSSAARSQPWHHRRCGIRTQPESRLIAWNRSLKQLRFGIIVSMMVAKARFINLKPDCRQGHNVQIALYAQAQKI